MLILSLATEVRAYEVPKNLSMGWDGKVQFGANASFGVADSAALSARSDITYRGDHFESEFTAKFYRSGNQVRVPRLNADGEPVRTVEGAILKDRVTTITNYRRFLGVQPRWFITTRYYLFGLADIEVNEPADIRSSSRQIGGAGYKFWVSRKNYVSAALGVGRKKLRQVSGGSEVGAIGYLSVRVRRKLSKTVRLSMDMDSDFGGGNRFSEIELALSWKLRDPMSISFKYEGRFNSNIINPLATFENDSEATMSVNIVVDVFE